MMNNLLQMLMQFKQSPMQFLMQRKFNVPPGMANDPQAMLNHLMKTGQVSQDAVNRAYQQMGMFK